MESGSRSVDHFLGMRACKSYGQALHPLLGVLAVLGLEHKGLVRREDLECLGDVAAATPDGTHAPDLTHFNGLCLLVVLQASVGKVCP